MQIDILNNLKVVLVSTRFPENIGMAARACANMGCKNLVLVNPERKELAAAIPLATNQGEEILKNITVYNSLKDAIAASQSIWATTARLGGWRKNYYSPETAARIISNQLQKNMQVSLLFGSERNGLKNDEISFSDKIIHIPTQDQAASLNLAQAVLLVLYEIFKFYKKLSVSYKDEEKIQPNLCPANKEVLNYEPFLACNDMATFKERNLLEDKLKDILIKLDCINGENANYHFLKWHYLINSLPLSRSDFNILMGFFRQIDNKTKK